MKKTKIEWCDSTFNPITGCLHHCPYCYARTMVYRFAGAIENEKQLYEDDEPVLDQEGRKIAYPHGFAPTFHKHRLAQVRHWKDEKPRNIFVCSMADIFGDWVPEEWITQITDAFKEAPQHNYLFLTKNPIRMISMIERGILEERENFWFGTTSTKAEDAFFTSETANAFVSIEPMHGPLEVIRRRAVLDHLQYLHDEQIDHLRKVQTAWNTSGYGEYQKEVDDLKEKWEKETDDIGGTRNEQKDCCNIDGGDYLERLS